MNKRKAKLIAETITNDQLLAMLIAARHGIEDWTARSRVNKGLTKGAAWNILGKGFDPAKNIHPLAKVNMIWEFGEFLPAELHPAKKEPRERPSPHHQDPDPIDEDLQKWFDA